MQPFCFAQVTLMLVVGRWKLMIVYWLLQKDHRFNELQRNLGPVTHKTLSTTLREMEADGLLRRLDFGEVPPRVEYSLTEKGRSLLPVLLAMQSWAESHHLDAHESPAVE